MSPLDPHRLTPSASINRVHIVNLPGLNPDTEVKGRTGYQLVSAAALSHMIRQYAPDLQLDPSADDGTLHQALDSSFTSSSQAVRAAAARALSAG